MSIRQRLRVILFLICSILTLLSGFVIWIVVENVQQIKSAGALVSELCEGTKIRTQIIGQMTEILDYHLSGDESYGKSFKMCGLTTNRLMNDWIKAKEARVLHDARKGEVRRVKQYFHDAMCMITDVCDKTRKQDNKDATKLLADQVKPWLGHKLFNEIDLLIDENLENVDQNFDLVLIRAGSAPWLANETLLQVKNSRAALDYLLAVDKVRLAVHRQMFEVKGYLISGKEEDLEAAQRTATEVGRTLQEWADTISAGLPANAMESDQKALSKTKAAYETASRNIDSALAIKMKGDRTAAYTIIEDQVDPVIQDVVLHTMNDARDRAETRIKHRHDALLRLSLLTGGLEVGLFLCVSCFLMLFSSKLIKRMIAAVATVKNGAEAIGAGNLEFQIELDTNDELGILASSVNQMAQDLAASQNMLVSAKNYLNNVIDSMPDSLMVVSAEGLVERANMATCRLLGYYQEEIISLPFSMVLVAAEELLAHTLTTKEPTRAVEKAYRTKDGIEIPVMFSCSIVQEVSTEQPAMVCVAVDISKQKLAEMELVNLNRRLALSNEELHEANEEIKKFTSIVSHDLRAPLVSIKGFSRELQLAVQSDILPLFTRFCADNTDEESKSIKGVLEEDVLQSLEYINSSVSRMDALISNILNLSRVGKRVLKLEPVNIKEITTTIVESLAYQIEQKHLNLIVGDLPQITADKLAMEQILGNLIDNALKYLDPQRSKEIEISAEQGDGEIIFRVRDDGRGIAKADIDKIFELFQRVGKRDVQGEGMGLTYVKALVRRHGGRIWCESRVEEGTSFFFTIPEGLTLQEVNR